MKFGCSFLRVFKRELNIGALNKFFIQFYFSIAGEIFKNRINIRMRETGLFRGNLIKLEQSQVHSKVGEFLNGPEGRKYLIYG